MGKNGGARDANAGAKREVEDDARHPVRDDLTPDDLDAQVSVRDQRGGFLWVANDVLRDYGPRVGAYGVAVYACLAMFANGDTSTCFPSHQVIADLLGLSRPTVLKALRGLAEVGLISMRQRRAGGQTSSEYTLLSPGATVARQRPQRPRAVNVVDSGCKRGLQRAVNVVDSNNTHSNNTHKQDVAPAAPNGFDGSHSQMVQAIADVCKLDLNLQGSRIGQTAKQLRESGYSVAAVRAFKAWWLADDWRRERRPYPSLEDVLRDLPKAVAAGAAEGPGAANDAWADFDVSRIRAEDVL